MPHITCFSLLSLGKSHGVFGLQLTELDPVLELEELEPEEPELEPPLFPVVERLLLSLETTIPTGTTIAMITIIATMMPAAYN